MKNFHSCQFPPPQYLEVGYPKKCAWEPTNHRTGTNITQFGGRFWDLVTIFHKLYCNLYYKHKWKQMQGQLTDGMITVCTM